MAVASDLPQKAAGPHPPAVGEIRFGPANDPVVENERPRGLEEPLFFVIHRHGKAEAMRQVNVIIIPYGQEVVAAQSGCGVSFLPDAVKPRSKVHDRHLRVIETDGFE